MSPGTRKHKAPFKLNFAASLKRSVKSHGELKYSGAVFLFDLVCETLMGINNKSFSQY